MDKLPKFTLPVWMDKGEVKKLRNATHRFWTGVYSWLLWPLKQIDPLTCDESLLDALAWQRDVTRFNNEPLELYRKRVNYAFVNARDAGGKSGFEAIFKRLGIGELTQLERQPHIDWDVITLLLSDEQISEHHDLLMMIVRQYGRTCRRYFFEVRNTYSMRLRVSDIMGEYVTYSARLASNECAVTLLTGSVQHESNIYQATLIKPVYGASLL
nr:hypothetical protein [Providencia rettgeri]